MSKRPRSSSRMPAATALAAAISSITPAAGAQPGGLPACRTQLGECRVSVETCQGDLTACGGDLATCDAELDAEIASGDACDGALATCDGSLSACGASLSSSNASLSGCMSGLSSCNANLSSCTNALATSNANLSTCNALLSSRTAALNACQGNLSTCRADLGACEDQVASFCPLDGMLQMLANFRDDRLAEGDTLSITHCGLFSQELEVLLRLDTSEGEENSHFLQISDGNADGVSDAGSTLFLFRDSPVTEFQVQFGYDLDGLPSSFATLLACRDRAAELGLCG